MMKNIRNTWQVQLPSTAGGVHKRSAENHTVSHNNVHLSGTHISKKSHNIIHFSL